MFTPQLWDRNGSGTQTGARVHTCSTASGRSGTNRPPRDVIAVERFRNGSGWLCGTVNAQPDAFRSRLASSCVIMKNMQYLHLSKDCLSGEKSTYFGGYFDFGTRVKTFGTSCIGLDNISTGIMIDAVRFACFKFNYVHFCRLIVIFLHALS